MIAYMASGGFRTSFVSPDTKESGGSNRRNPQILPLAICVVGSLALVIHWSHLTILSTNTFSGDPFSNTNLAVCAKFRPLASHGMP